MKTDKQRLAETAASMRYYWKNRDRILADQKTCEKKILARRAAALRYYYRNRDRISAALNTPANREYLRKYRKKYNEANRERRKAHATAYRLKYPEKWAAMRQVIMSRRRGNGGSFSVDEWVEKCAGFGNVCVCCGGGGKLTVDHITPASEGGGSFIENIQPLCQSCNSSKHTKTIEYLPGGWVD